MSGLPHCRHCPLDCLHTLQEKYDALLDEVEQLRATNELYRKTMLRVMDSMEIDYRCFTGTSRDANPPEKSTQ